MIARPFENLVIPGIVTTIIHVAAVLLLFYTWQVPVLTAKRPELQVMHAQLVELKQKAPNKPKTSVSPPKPAPKPAPKKPDLKKPEPAPAPKPAPPKPTPPKPVSKPVPPAPSEADVLARLQAEARARQEEALRAQQEREAQEQQGKEDEQLAASYIGMIKSAVEDSWSRPPSARRDMRAVVSIRLVPTGELVNVALVQGSGDAAFDRSVLQAIEKAAPFTELKGMPTNVFEKYFRTFTLEFNPEDLRI